jgi:hypothetical protein
LSFSNCKSGWNFGYVEIKNERLENDNKYYFSFFINDNVKVGIFTDNSLDKSIDTMLDIYLLISVLNHSSNLNPSIPPQLMNTHFSFLNCQITHLK